MILTMKHHRKAQRIMSLIDRLDARGERLMAKAVACYGAPDYKACVYGIFVMGNRCLKLANYLDSLSSGTQRRTA